MDLDELDFTEICRCCKRTNSEMISIFDVNADPSYPPVDKMLISIASLNVQENDGLPSLVCTLCLNNIQDAFTFILQITLIDKELSQMFATRKQANTLQDTYGICESVKIEEDEYEPDQAGAADSEDVKLSLKVEDLDGSMQNYYQHRSADNSDENIDVVVQAEGVLVPSEIEGAKKLQAQSEQWEELNFGTSIFACEVCNQEFNTTQQLENHKIIYCVKSESSAITIPWPKEDIQKYYSESIMEDEEISLQLRAKQRKTTSKALNHADAPDKEKEPSPLTTVLETQKNLEDMKKSYTRNDNLSVNDKPLLMVQKDVDLEDFEDVDDMGVDEDYQEDVEDSISVDSSESEYTPHGSRKRKQKCSAFMAGSSHISVQEKNKTKAEKQQSNVDNVDSSDDASNQGAAETYNEADDEEMEGNITGRSQKSRVKEKKKTERQQSNVDEDEDDVDEVDEDEDEPMDDDDSLVGAAKRVDDNEIERIYPNSRTKQQKKLEIFEKVEDMEDFEDVDEDYEEIDEICPKSPKRGNLTAKIHTMYKCKLCRYSSAIRCMLKRHLQVHCKEQPFSCSKCNGTFGSRRYYMLYHERNCNGKISKYSHGEQKAVNRVISLQDLDDPLIMNKYYTMTEICVQDNNGDVTDVTVQRPKDRRGRKSSATSAITIPRPNKEDIQKYYSDSEMDDEVISLQLRTKRRKTTLRSSNRTDAPDKEKEPSPLISMTLQNQKDVEKLKKSNSYIGNEHLSVNDDDGSTFTVFKCNLCGYTSNYITYLHRHLRSHSKEKPFQCSKCKGAFALKYNMLQHRRKCNGKNTTRKDRLNHVIPFQDLNDPLKMKKYFTVTKIDVQNNNGDNVKVQRPKGGREEVEIK